MSILIGSLTIDDPVILAPMSGVTDLPFRRVVKERGAALVVSEMIASQAAIRETRQSLIQAMTCPDEQPMSKNALCGYCTADVSSSKKLLDTITPEPFRMHTPAARVIELPDKMKLPALGVSTWIPKVLTPSRRLFKIILLSAV